MTACNQFRTINSKTDFTIFSIDRSEAGLETLMQDARLAGCALADDDITAGLHLLQSLIGHLYDFRRFIREVSTSFSMDLAEIRDANGSFEDNAERFRATLHALSAALENHDTAALARLLSVDLSASLWRFKEMLPLLRECIEADLPGAA